MPISPIYAHRHPRCVEWKCSASRGCPDQQGATGLQRRPGQPLLWLGGVFQRIGAAGLSCAPRVCVMRTLVRGSRGTSQGPSLQVGGSLILTASHSFRELVIASYTHAVTNTMRRNYFLWLRDFTHHTCNIQGCSRRPYSPYPDPTNTVSEKPGRCQLGPNAT